jgi:drug/metabolite transporter (DMT)-like permease
VILAVVLALAAAVSNAVNLMTQHLASVAAPGGVAGLRLARYLIRQPLWLLGAAAGLGSYLLQAGALHNGPLSLVQPLLVTELIFVMVLRRVWIHQQVRPAAWAAVLTVAVSLAVFLAAAEPAGGQPSPRAAEWLSAGVVFGGIIAGLALLGMHGSPVRRAGLLAAAAGMTWAMEAVFLKTATETLTVSGPVAMLTSWPAYAFAAATATGTVLQQAALHVGPLSVSQPLLAIVDPLAAIVLSVWLFGERFTGSPADTAIAIVAFGVMAVGVTALTRTAPQELSRDEGRPPPPPAQP